MIDSENNSANTEDYIIILTTIAANQKAEQIASKLVKLNLAACIQIDKVRSIYFWKNDICKSSEYRLMIKTISTNYQNIENVIRQLSDYDNPQIVQLKLSAGSNEYLNWISKSCKKQNQ
ncbi:divalent-cation tolerance protein CutA [Orientia tsutsugamushi]|uniref:divalent-cation tolerance protein CutA n=1 Tax=Orientia tsutsugamushi TaxID=784 RepID=UPI00315CA64D